MPRNTDPRIPNATRLPVGPAILDFVFLDTDLCRLGAYRGAAYSHWRSPPFIAINVPSPSALRLTDIADAGGVR